MSYKMVVFDLDGTIIDGIESVWKTLHDFFGINEHPQRLKLREKFYSGEIGYREWAEGDLSLMVEHGADRKSVMKALEKTRLMEGAMNVIDTLKRNGVKVAIISGSVDILLGKFIPDYDKVFDHVLINRIMFGGDGKIKGIESTPFDIFQKRTGLVKICKAEGLKAEDCAFIGDHDNDVEIAKAAGFSIAFNSKSEALNEVSDVIIEKKDLREILKYL